MKLVCCNLAARRRFPSSCCSFETSNSAVSKQLDQKKSTETVHRQMHRSKRTVITIMLTIHPSLCSLPPSAPELCGTNFNESSVTGGVRFLISCLQQNAVRIQHKQRCTQQKELVGVLWVSTRLLLECHADFRSCSQATSSSALRKQLTSCFGAGRSVIRTSTVVGIQSALLVSITVKTLQTHLRSRSHGFSEITSCKSSKNRMCLIKNFTARFNFQKHLRTQLAKMWWKGITSTWWCLVTIRRIQSFPEGSLFLAGRSDTNKQWLADSVLQFILNLSCFKIRDKCSDQ